jgi:hypothetical protein
MPKIKFALKLEKVELSKVIEEEELNPPLLLKKESSCKKYHHRRSSDQGYIQPFEPKIEEKSNLNMIRIKSKTT